MAWQIHILKFFVNNPAELFSVSQPQCSDRSGISQTPHSARILCKYLHYITVQLHDQSVLTATAEPPVTVHKNYPGSEVYKQLPSGKGDFFCIAEKNKRRACTIRSSNPPQGLLLHVFLPAFLIPLPIVLSKLRLKSQREIHKKKFNSEVSGEQQKSKKIFLKTTNPKLTINVPELQF